MRKLLLHCNLSLGDIVMLTAAVRDLHVCYPGEFLTDVETPFPALWENNPYITPFEKTDSSVERIKCLYPLIDRSNEAPYHCLHGFIEFLNDDLGLSIKPTAFKGDIHLSGLEKTWASQVHELTGADTPFWIVAAGGKYDVSIKWWESKRYQEVVDRFRGKIAFVQIGNEGDHHPKLYNTVDLRGKTDVRQLIRLVYHAQGVLCSVTGVMHLCAAIETRRERAASRPCVVVAGGREPAYWEAYPDHQFIHTNGALPCCIQSGCWKDRTFRLNDGDHRDKKRHLCVEVVNGLPHCMSLITPARVADRISFYFEGGACQYLTVEQQGAANRGITATARNGYGEQTLTLPSAGMACDAFVKTIPDCPEHYAGRGIVICGGGTKYFTNAWVCIHILRSLGCSLPVEFWHLDEKEVDSYMSSLLLPFNVKCVDAQKVRKRFRARRLGGWELKPYAILHSRFREVLLLDADNVPVKNPEFLFETAEFKDSGAIFWPDYERPNIERQNLVWRSCGMRRPLEPEFETGQIVVDKKRCWEALSLTMWMNENSDFYYQYLHGDKETFHIAFRKTKTKYALIPHPIHSLFATMCQHDFDGRRLFQHRNSDKWDFLMHNRHIEDFRFEEECLSHLAQLRRVWDGGKSKLSQFRLRPYSAKKSKPKSSVLAAVMVSCQERSELREQTILRLRETDWGDNPLHVQIDVRTDLNHRARHLECVYRALETGCKLDIDYILLLEDDLDFNRHIYSNLSSWDPLKRGEVSIAGLYNFQARELACDLTNNARIVDPASIFGSQAFLFSRRSAERLLHKWEKLEGGLEARIRQIFDQTRHAFFYHAPSLVQHLGKQSVRQNAYHEAMDFSRDWKSKNAAFAK